ILAVALNYQLEEQEKRKAKKKHRPVILVSKDTLVRIKADVMGVTAEDYLTDHIVNTDAMYTGYVTLHVHPSLIDEFYSYRSLPIQSLSGQHSFRANEFVILKDELGTTKSALLKISKDVNKLEPMYLSNDPVWGITARNVQQRMALELLLNDDIPLVTLTG